jgi:hypothetical protein
MELGNLLKGLKEGICEVAAKPSPDAERRCLELRLPSFRTERSKFMLFMNYPVCAIL